MRRKADRRPKYHLDAMEDSHVDDGLGVLVVEAGLLDRGQKVFWGAWEHHLRCCCGFGLLFLPLHLRRRRLGNWLRCCLRWAWHLDNLHLLDHLLLLNDRWGLNQFWSWGLGDNFLHHLLNILDWDLVLLFVFGLLRLWGWLWTRFRS